MVILEAVKSGAVHVGGVPFGHFITPFASIRECFQKHWFHMDPNKLNSSCDVALISTFTVFLVC